MELDDIKANWQALDYRFEQQYELSLRVLREDKLERTRRSMRPWWVGQVVKIGVGLVTMVLFAPYWVANRHTPHLLVYGLMMHVYGLMLVLTGARNLQLQSRLDYTVPVIEIQRQLAALCVWRLREAVLYGVSGCFIWIPLILIGLAHSGFDLWVIKRSLVWADVASGVACLIVIYAVVHWSRGQGRERFRAALEGSIIGRSIRKSQATVDEVAKFEQS
jgi:hypothetical protein